MNDTSKKVPVKRDEKAWEPLVNLRDEIDHLFDEFQDGWPFERMRRRRRPFAFGTPFAISIRMPAVDIVDGEKEVLLKAELPGMDEKDIEVKIAGNMLTISGEKKEEREEGEEGGDYYLSERRYGSFERSLSIPEGIDEDNVEASFDKGVLTITLPKTPEAQVKAKKIEVTSKG